MEFGLDQLLVRSWSNCIHPSGHVEAVAAWDHYTEQRGDCSIHDRGDWYGEKGHLVQSLYTATHHRVPIFSVPSACYYISRES